MGDSPITGNSKGPCSPWLFFARFDEAKALGIISKIKKKKSSGFKLNSKNWIFPILVYFIKKKRNLFFFIKRSLQAFTIINRWFLDCCLSVEEWSKNCNHDLNETWWSLMIWHCWPSLHSAASMKQKNRLDGLICLTIVKKYKNI